MFETLKLKKQLAEKKLLIQTLEQKRMRSQAAILEAILAHEDPSDEDTDYFNDFTAQITKVRGEIHDLQKLLNITDD